MVPIFPVCWKAMQANAKWDSDSVYKSFYKVMLYYLMGETCGLGKREHGRRILHTRVSSHKMVVRLCQDKHKTRPERLRRNPVLVKSDIHRKNSNKEICRIRIKMSCLTYSIYKKVCGLLILMVGHRSIRPLFEGIKSKRPFKDIWASLSLVDFYIISGQTNVELWLVRKWLWIIFVYSRLFNICKSNFSLKISSFKLESESPLKLFLHLKPHKND